MTETAGIAGEPILLEAIAAEIESFVGQSGWDSPTTLFALVPTRTLAVDPAAASILSADGSPLDPEEISPHALTPIAQDELPDGPLDEVLAQIGWPQEVVGCAVSQEILMLPPSAEDALDDLAIDEAVTTAATHPDRREARLVIAVLRSGRSAGVLRLRGLDGAGDDLLTGPDLAPNLAGALAATLAD
ncbi:PPA1309 family protein [Jatrophihabitans telluris]|uniref:PPA1309 family protein n=1 Tax=Jatrophihabitans telluris TaxID=2038343 RepID=A0ABY4R3A4_9ACTN|nr:PPA1309 family protein [Jatrophihabitans telluris]UQX89736.1 PPA1309 family protein [Jatrophihabitans telluris]